MRLTVVKEDTLVIIDGIGFRGIDMSSMSADFWALQWYDTWGEKELIDPDTRVKTNVPVDDLSPYQSLIDQWNTRKEESEIPQPPPEPEIPYSITRRQCALQLLSIGTITGPEAVSMTKDGTPPPSVQAYINNLPEDQRYLAEIDFAATFYLRDNPLLLALMAANNMDSEQVDAFFIAADKL